MSRPAGARDVERAEFTCVVCGAKFIASAHRKAMYCSIRCKDRYRKGKTREDVKAMRMEKTGLTIDCPLMTPEYYAKHKDKIAHQRDTSVWTRDYAERQKAQTLAMAQGITLYASDTYTVGHNEEQI